jgi:serine/threonine protein kinase
VKLDQGMSGAVYKVQLNNGEETAYKFVKERNNKHLWAEMLEIGMLQLITNNTHNGTRYFPELYDWGFKEKDIPSNFFDFLWWGMELAEIDLNKLIQMKVLEVDMIHKISFQIASGLEFLHKHEFAHCDLKPANIGINPTHDNSTRLLDLGSMTDMRGAPEEQKSGTMITRWYRPPEISYTYNHTTRMSTYTTTADMWSLGCIIVEMFTGYAFLQGAYDYMQGPDFMWPVSTQGADEGPKHQIIECIDLCLQLGQFDTMDTFIGNLKKQPYINCKRPGGESEPEEPELSEEEQKVSQFCSVCGVDEPTAREQLKSVDWDVDAAVDNFLAEEMGESLWGEPPPGLMEVEKTKWKSNRRNHLAAKAAVFNNLSIMISTRQEKYTRITSMKDIILSQPKRNSASIRDGSINNDTDFINNVLPRLFDFDFVKRCSATDFLGRLSESDEALATSYTPIHALDPYLLGEFRELYDLFADDGSIVSGQFRPAQKRIQEHKTFFQKKARSHKRLIFAKVLQSPLCQGLDINIYDKIIHNFS